LDFFSTDTFSYSYEGTGSYSFTADLSDGEPSDDPTKEPDSLSISGTTTESGGSSLTTTVNGNYDSDGLLNAITITDTWHDYGSFTYTGGGSYSIGDFEGTIVEHGGDGFDDTGSTTLSYSSGSGWSLSGNRTFHVWGDSYEKDSWSTPYDSDSSEMDMDGTVSGSTTIDNNFDDLMQFELVGRQVPIENAGDTDDSTSLDDDEFESLESDVSESLDDESLETETRYFWELVGGSFLDEASIEETLEYDASGTYNSTSGVGAADDGTAADLGVPVTGTVTHVGSHTSTVWTTFEGIRSKTNSEK
jgi:hypothetical protein